MCEITTGFVDKTLFPEDASKFLLQKGIYDYESIALMAADEKEVAVGVIEILKANGCSSMDVITGQLAAKKIGKACRALYGSNANPIKETAVVDARSRRQTRPQSPMRG